MRHGARIESTCSAGIRPRVTPHWRGGRDTLPTYSWPEAVNCCTANFGGHHAEGAPADVAKGLTEFWSQVIGAANGNLFKVAKGIGSTTWHTHEDQEENSQCMVLAQSQSWCADVKCW